MPQRRLWPILLAAALGGCAGRPHQATPLQVAPADTDWTKAEAQKVDLSDFAFTPEHLQFRSGVPVRLTLVNTGSDRHDFSAPEFFASSAFKQGGALPVDGKVSLAKGESAEIDLVPAKPGHYGLDCTEFLHDVFGMTGDVTVL